MKIFRNKNRAGFTLLEIILVILIISMLATLAIMNFQPIRQQAQIALAADQFVNFLDQARNAATTGKTGEDSTTKCWGLKISKTQIQDNPEVFLFNTNIERQFKQKTIETRCKADTNSINYLNNLGTKINNIEIKSIQTSDEQELNNELFIFSLPPKGDIKINNQESFTLDPQLQKATSITFKIGIQNNDSEDAQKTITYNLLTGKAEVQ